MLQKMSLTFGIVIFPFAPANYLVLVTVQYDYINRGAYALDMTPQQRILLSV